MKEILITSSVLILLVLVLRLFLHKWVNRRVCYSIWLLVALRLLIPVQLGDLDFGILKTAEPVTEVITEVSRNPVIGPSRDEVYEQITQEHIQQGQDVSAPEVQQQIQTQVEQAITAPTVGQIATAVWIGGMALMTGWFLFVNISHSIRLRRTAEPVVCPESPVPVWVSADAVSPCLVGLLRPVVYLTPESTMDPKSMRHVLTHELTHYRHGDHLWSLVRCVCLCVHWFNPLVWVAAVVSRRDCELACDEGALKRLGESERIPYGKTLLETVSHASKHTHLLQTATSMNESKRQLTERVNYIVKKQKVVWVAVVTMVLVSLFATACAFAGVAPASNGQQETEPTSPTTPLLSEQEQLYMRFMAGEVPAVDKAGTEKNIGEYFSNGELTRDYTYAFYDVSGDGEAELCIHQLSDICIFTVKEDAVYHWCTNDKSQTRLLNNGAILREWHGTEPEHILYEYHEYDENGNLAVYQEFACWDDGSMMAGYNFRGAFFVDQEEVSQEVFAERVGPYLSIGSERVVWHDSSGNPLYRNSNESKDLISFRVNDGMNEFFCLIETDPNNPDYISDLVIIDKITGETVQGIRLPLNEMFTEGTVYPVDLSSDGNLDLLIAKEKTTYAAYFLAYIWDESRQLYVYAPAFETFPNFTLSESGQYIFMHSSGDQNTNYGMAVYSKREHDFLKVCSLEWGPTLENGMVELRETELVGKETVMTKQLTLKLDDPYKLDENDTQTAMYYLKGSKWDLNSSKWDPVFRMTNQSQNEQNQGAANSYGLTFVYNGADPFPYMDDPIDTSSCVIGSFYYYDVPADKVFFVTDEDILFRTGNKTHVFYVKRSEPNRIYMTPKRDFSQHSLLYESKYGNITESGISADNGFFEGRAISIIEENNRFIWLDIESGEIEVMLEMPYISHAYVEHNNENYHVKHWSEFNEIYFIGKLSPDEESKQYVYSRRTGEVKEDHRL